MRYLWIPVIMIIGVSGCVNPDQTTQFETDLISLNHLIDSVFSEPGQDSIRSVTKTIRITGESPESRQISEHNILEDLDQIRGYDVATPRWADFVEVQQRDSAGFQLIRYTLTNKRAPVQWMTFMKKNGKLERLQIYSRKKSVVSEQIVLFNWEPGHNYTLQNESKLLLREPNVFAMTVNYE